MMTRRSTARCIVALVLLVLTLFLAPPPIAHAATLYVTTLADSGVGSLRYAILSAGNNDTIRFSVSGTIFLSSSLPHVTQNPLTMDGQGQAVAIDGQSAYQILYVDSNKLLHLKNLTIAYGSAVSGGGLYVAGNATSANTVDNVTFVGNSSTTTGGGGGGAILNASGDLNVTNSTFYANSAVGHGGALYNSNGYTLYVNNSTFYLNSAPAGGAVYNNSGIISLRSTILAHSVTGTNCYGINIWDGDNSGNGYNLEDGTSCGFSGANHSLSSTNPRLGPLTFNGGPTRTMALISTSQAVNKIPNGTNGCGTTITTDQRGMSRPQGTLCDMGAFEIGLPGSLTITGGNSQQAIVNHAFHYSLDVNVADAFNTPLDGVNVTYTGPSSGAGIASGGTVATNMDGNASYWPSANGKVGGPYAVTASVTGLAAAPFYLTNLPYPLYLPLVLR